MFISFCANYFVANCETLITNRKPAGALIEAIGVADLCIFVRHFHPVSLRFLCPKVMLVVPLCVPLFTSFSGHSSLLRDTEGHKKSASLLSVCDFVRNIEGVQIACEASALPLSQAGDKSFIINKLQGYLD
ncbi:MAG: hypothetical protein ACREBG_13405, partial [Pyrinomonadaceae bacterium]